MGKSNVLLLGFDGLDFRHINRFSDSLPNFTRLKGRGPSGPLASTFPPMTPSAWPSIYTGVDPSHHGVYDFRDVPDRPGPGEDTVDRTDVTAPALWNYLTVLDVPSIALNVPMTSPPDDVNGVIVPGFTTPVDATGHPTGIIEELSAALGREYRIYPESDTVPAYLDIFRMRTKASKYLLDEYEWRFAFFQLQHTDSVFHYRDDEEDFRRVIEAADEYLGEMLDYVGSDTHIIVCSDHGIDRTRGHTIYVNQLLHDQGYLQLEETQATDKSGYSTPPQIQRFINTILTSGYQALNRLGVAEQFRSVLPTDTLKDTTRRPVDWHSSVAYCRSGTELGIRINRTALEQTELFEFGAMEVQDELISYLSELQTPDGTPAFEYVKPREAVYDGGKHIQDAPDVVCMPFTRGNTISPDVFGPSFRPNDSYEHRPNGVFIGSSPMLQTENDIQISHTDIAPTVMSLLDVPVPERMCGQPPDELGLETTSEVYEDVPYVSAGGENDSQVTNRLRDLGYL